MSSRGNISPPIAAAHNDDVSLTDTLLVLWRYKVVLLGVPVALALLAFALSARRTPQYEAVSKVELKMSDGRLVPTQIIESLRTRINSVMFAERIATTTVVEIDGRKLSGADLSRLVVTQGVRNSGVILIRVTTSSPEAAAKVANLFADAATAGAAEGDVEVKTSKATEAKLEESRQALERFYERTPKSFWDNHRSSTDWPRKLSRMDMEYDQLMSNYRASLELLAGQQLAEAAASQVTLADRASAPVTPLSPRPLRSSAIAFAVGGIAAVLLVLLIDAVRARLAELR